MYCGMSLSRFESAAMYAGLPPLTPPSSLYCCHKSLSISSTAANKRKIATSPCVIAPPAAIASLDEQSTTRHRGDARQAYALQERSPPNDPPPLGVEIILD